MCGEGREWGMFSSKIILRVQLHMYRYLFKNKKVKYYDNPKFPMKRKSLFVPSAFPFF